MAPPSDFDEEGVRILLLGDAPDIERALDSIQRHLRDYIGGWIRRKFPGLPAADLADVWGDTLCGVFEAVREGRFDGDRSLIPWVRQIAYRRAVDRTRRNECRGDALVAVGERLRATQAGLAWQGLSVAERNEVAAQICAAIATLPGRQRQVLQAFVDWYPETDRNNEFLRKKVSEEVGQELTLVQVKRALQEGRERVRNILGRKGYDPQAARW